MYLFSNEKYSLFFVFWRKVMKNGYTFCIISRMKRLRRGFSLLEVVIMVVIVGIPATLAYPSLEGHLQRS